MSVYKWKKKVFFPAVLFSMLFTVACSEDASNVANKSEAVVKMEVFKQASCGCCKKWISHMEDAGFDVKARNRVSLNVIKKEFGVAPRYQSCHTAVAEGYVFEGHIPADIVQRFLDDRPEGVIGLAVPGMPVGSPGMEVGDRLDPYDVLVMKKDGTTEVYAHISASSVN
jgi:hypothetical protein